MNFWMNIYYYQASFKTLINMKVDNFSLIGKIIWYSIFGIGYLMLYSAYFSPDEWGKKRNTSVTARRLKYKHLWGPINAIVVLFLLFLFLFGEQLGIVGS